MARAERVGLSSLGPASLGIGLVVALLIGLRQVGPASEQIATAPPAAGSADADAKEFLRLLGSFRRNDEPVLPAMRVLAEKLCVEHARCDVKDVLAFYEAMSPEDRRRGAEEQARVAEIVAETQESYEAGVPNEEWIEVRDNALDALRAIVERTVAHIDVFPRASALSFCARLETDQLLADYGLDEHDRAELLATARADASASLAAMEKCGVVTPRLEPIWLLGYLHAASGDTALARRAFEDCLALARRFGRLDWQADAIQGLVDLAREAGDVEEVALLLRELARFRAPAESWFLVREQSDLLLQRDLVESSIQLLLANPPSTPRERREWYILLGSAFLRRGDLDGARQYYALAEPLPFSRDVALGMASVDLKAGNAERVLAQLSNPEFRASLYPFEETLALQIRGEAALELGRYADAVVELDRALQIGGRIQQRITDQRNLVRAATSVVGEGVGLHTLALAAEARIHLGEHLEAARAIETWQSRTLRKASGEDVSTQDLLSWARTADLGLLTWVVGANSAVAAHVSPDGTALAVPIRRGRKAIEAAVRRLGEAIRGSDGALADRLADEIRSELLPPALEARFMGAEQAGRLLVLAHGPIERLPIEFLFREQPVVPLVLPGLPAPAPGTAVGQHELVNWSILGSPLGSDGRPSLPGARDELAAIAGLHGRGRVDLRGEREVVLAGDAALPGITMRIGYAFDREALTEALRGRAPLHVATHLRHGCGAAQGRLADIGLELSDDDVFCAREIVEIGPSLPLAVLSACETAEGRFVDAEGLQGVARAFLESGTRNLLVTLWPVEDQSARGFAVSFHRALVAGERPSGAAATARAELRAAGAPPADWAAFRLIGRD